jgi:uncharacterized protein YjbI with pentapeptide repeats
MKTYLFLFIGALGSGALARTPCTSALTRQPMECVVVAGHDLSKKTLDTVDWSGADARGANLRKASIRHAYLIEANLAGADLREANLYGTSLYGAKLSGTDLRGADLRGTHLAAADLATVIVDDETLFNGAAMNSKTKLPLVWGRDEAARRVEANRRGILTIRE